LFSTETHAYDDNTGIDDGSKTHNTQKVVTRIDFNLQVNHKVCQHEGTIEVKSYHKLIENLHDQIKSQGERFYKEEIRLISQRDQK